MSDGSVLDPLGDGISTLELIEVAGDDASIVRAARVSYGRDRTPFDPDRDGKLIRYLLANAHGTPLEHNHLTVRLKAPLYCIQELLRHRIGVSVNQASHRYTVSEPEFYIPRTFRIQDSKNKQASAGAHEGATNAFLVDTYATQCRAAYASYQQLLRCGAPREQARGVLPHCTYSSLYWTANLRSLFAFLALRLAPNAQWELRQYARGLVSLIEPHYPVTFAAWRELGMDTAAAEES